jgi:hypothetical protein
MEKVVRDGCVAVLYSPGYGAGWYSWHQREALLFHPTIVELVENGQNHLITDELVATILGTEDYVCILGAKDLEIEWIKEGELFEINEYDGSESVRIHSRMSGFITA